MAVPKSELAAPQASALEAPACKREKREERHQDEGAEMFSKALQVCVCMSICLPVCVPPAGQLCNISCSPRLSQIIPVFLVPEFNSYY